MSIRIENDERGLCWDTAMHWMGYGEIKWSSLRTVRYMIEEGYCQYTLTALFEDACDRWPMGDDTQDVLKWLRDPDYVFPEESIFYRGDEE